MKTSERNPCPIFTHTQKSCAAPKYLFSVYFFLLVCLLIRDIVNCVVNTRDG